MSLARQVILHSLLNHCSPSDKEMLLELLDPAEKEALLNVEPTYGNPLESREDPGFILDWVHHSWITPFLRTLSEREIGLFLSCLNHEKNSRVSKDLLYTSKFYPLSDMGKLFLQKTLARYLTAEMDDLLPIECLPQSPLNTLLQLSYDKLASIIDLLAMHDLSVEIRQIIDRQKISKIYTILSTQQQDYLKILSQSHEPVIFNSMGITHWKGDLDKLQLLIRQRGANRLAKACYRQDLSFQWYLLHRFDFEKALLLRKLLNPTEQPRTSQLLIQQIVELLNYTQEK